MPSIYDISFPQQVTDLTPPNKRTPKLLAWLKALMSPMTWLHGNVFTEYVNGSTSPYFDSITIYAKTDRVIDPEDHGVYESTFDFVTNGNPNPNDDLTHWQKITDDFRGVRERVSYTGEKLSMEFMLNKFFRTTFRQPGDITLPDIWIENHDVMAPVFIFGYVETESSSFVSNDIYAENFFVNEYDFDAVNFTIWVPVAVWTALADTADQRNSIIRAEADRVVIAGVIYDIQTY